MEIFASIALIFCVCILPGMIADHKATKYQNSNYDKIDLGKMNTDRIMNNLSNYQVNQNLVNGKYDKPVINKSSDTWEDFKKRHPWGSWN